VGTISKKFLERLTICSIVSLTWQGHAPRPQNPAKLSKPRRPPGGALPFWRASFAKFTIVERDFRCSRSRSKSPRALGHLFSITHPRNLPLPRRRSRPPKGRSIKIIEKFRVLSSTSRPAPTRREALTVWRGRAGTTNICRFVGSRTASPRRRSPVASTSTAGA
jgi:hypothetical protein